MKEEIQVYKFKEEIQLIVVLAQKSRHIVETCWRNLRCISPVHRDHVWVGAVWKDMLLIFIMYKLYIISIAQVISKEGIVGPGHPFSSFGAGTKSEADDVLRKVKKHVSGKDVWQTSDQGPFCREGASLN